LKFFVYKYNQKKNLNQVKNKEIQEIYESDHVFIPYNEDYSVYHFNKFLIKNGLLTKSKYILSLVFKNFNYFLYYNKQFLFKNYPNQKWIVEDMLFKKLNYLYVFNLVSNLIKPPFVIKSVLIPKKLRKKTKQKYLIKIVYKHENKRLKNSYKQLHYYSNKFSDSKFSTRLYKSLTFSFLDWKNSYLFKVKTIVFKKFFKS